MSFLSTSTRQIHFVLVWYSFFKLLVQQKLESATERAIFCVLIVISAAPWCVCRHWRGGGGLQDVFTPGQTLRSHKLLTYHQPCSLFCETSPPADHCSSEYLFLRIQRKSFLVRANAMTPFCTCTWQSCWTPRRNGPHKDQQWTCY